MNVGEKQNKKSRGKQYLASDTITYDRCVCGTFRERELVNCYRKIVPCALRVFHTFSILSTIFLRTLTSVE